MTYQLRRSFACFRIKEINVNRRVILYKRSKVEGRVRGRHGRGRKVSGTGIGTLTKSSDPLPQRRKDPNGGKT